MPGASEVLTHGFCLRPRRLALRASRPAPISTLGFEVLVQEVIAAITTSPWPRSKSVAFDGVALRAGRRSSCTRLPARSAKPAAMPSSGDAAFGTLRAGHRRHDGRRGRARAVGEDRIGRAGVAPHALRLGIGLDERDAVFGAAGHGEVADGLGIDREEAAGRAIFRAPCCRWWRGRPASCWTRPGPKNSTNLPTTPFLRSIWVTVSTRSVAVTPSLSLPVRRKPMTSGSSMETGWPSMAASASMPPTPQPSTPRPLIMVVCESVPTQVSG